MSNLDPHLDPHLDPPGTLITQPNGSPDLLLPRPLAQPSPPSPNLPTQARLPPRICPTPHSMLAMPGKPAVLLSDLTSDLVYPAALVPHAFSPGREFWHT